MLQHTAGEFLCSVFACFQLSLQRPFVKLSGCPQRFLPHHLDRICGALSAFKAKCLNCSYGLVIRVLGCGIYPNPIDGNDVIFCRVIKVKSARQATTPPPLGVNED